MYTRLTRLIAIRKITIIGMLENPSACASSVKIMSSSRRSISVVALVSFIPSEIRGISKRAMDPKMQRMLISDQNRKTRNLERIFWSLVSGSVLVR